MRKTRGRKVAARAHLISPPGRNRGTGLCGPGRLFPGTPSSVRNRRQALVELQLVRFTRCSHYCCARFSIALQERQDFIKELEAPLLKQDEVGCIFYDDVCL
jgi:hypothetical protein